MDPFEIQWRRAALRELRRPDGQVVCRVLEAVTQLADDPFPAGVRKLQGSEHACRIRIGDYRVIYEVDFDSRQVVVARVRHRRDVYR